MAATWARQVFFFATLLLVQAASCTEEEQVKTCASGTLSASVSPVEPSVSIQCGQLQGNRLRSVNMMFSLFVGEACDEKSSEDAIDNVLAPLDAAGEWSGPKLTITKFPPRNGKVCLLCSDGNSV